MMGKQGSRRRAGQSSLEFLLVMGVVLAAIIAVVTTAFKQRVTDTVNNGGEAVQKAVDQFKDKVVDGK